MLIPAISAKAVRDRSPQALGVGAGLGLLVIGLIAIGKAMEDTIAEITDSLPAAYSGLLGSSEGNYVINTSFGLIMPIAICVIAISAATRAFAREENLRTADLVLTQPVTRRELVVSKAAVLVGNVAIATALFSAGGIIGASVVDLDGVTPSLMAAGAIHVGFLGLMIGMIALAAANVSGSAMVGTGVAAGVGVVSNLASGLLPLSDATDWAAQLSPWHYFNGSAPTTNGVDVTDLAVMTMIAAIAFGVAIVAVEQRDVGSYRSSGALARLLRFSRPNVSTILTKSITERSIMLGVASYVLIAMAFVCGLMYEGLADTLIDFSDDLPDAFAGLIGTSEIGTPAGWVQAEMMSTIAPLVMVGVGVAIGVGAIAGEADRHTLPMLVVSSVSRRSIVIEKAIALATGLVAVGVVGVVALAAASAIGGLELGIIDIVGALAHVTLLGIFFGTLALAIGAATSKTVAMTSAAIVAVVAYLADWLLGISESTDQFARLSPWFYASDAEAIVSGPNWSHLALLAVLSVAAVSAAVALFDRREVNA